jgi:hypothetical protein
MKLSLRRKSKKLHRKLLHKQLDFQKKIFKMQLAFHVKTHKRMLHQMSQEDMEQMAEQENYENTLQLMTANQQVFHRFLSIFLRNSQQV